MVGAASDKQKAATQLALVRGVTVGLIVGGVLYTVSTVIGSLLPPGWEDLLQGVSVFVGFIAGAIVARLRLNRAEKT